MRSKTVIHPIHEHLQLHASQFKQKIQHPSHHIPYTNTQHNSLLTEPVHLHSLIPCMSIISLLSVSTQIAFLRWPNVGSTLYTTMAHGRHTTQIAFLRWPNVGSTLYTTMTHGRHTTLDQCSFDRWRMVG